MACILIGAAPVGSRPLATSDARLRNSTVPCPHSWLPQLRPSSSTTSFKCACVCMCKCMRLYVYPFFVGKSKALLGIETTVATVATRPQEQATDNNFLAVPNTSSCVQADRYYTLHVEHKG